MRNTTPKLLAGLIIVVAVASLTQPLRAGAIDTLVITENSSTSLTAVLNGTTSLTVTPGMADHWTISLNGVSSSAPFPGHVWFEPDGSGLFNQVAFFTPNQLSVVSDI